MLRAIRSVWRVLCVLVVCRAAGAAEPPPPRPLPTPGQAKILAALDDAAAIDVSERPLAEVVDFLKQNHGIDIQLDNKALSDAGIGSDTPLTIRLSAIKLRSLLRLTLSSLELTYIIGDGYLLITSKVEAESSVHFRIYPVRDLVTSDTDFRSPHDPVGKRDADFGNLIDLITSCVEPTTWDDVGGPGSINGHRNSLTLTVSQTDEVHEQVSELLSALRRVRDKQLAAGKLSDADDSANEEEDEDPLEVRAYPLWRAPPPAMTMKVPGQQLAQAPPLPDEELDPEEKAAAEERAQRKLETWAQAIVELAPEMIEPDSWEPKGPGRIRAVANTIIVKQTDDVHLRMLRLINDMLPGSLYFDPFTQMMWRQNFSQYHPSVPLKLPSLLADWPRQAEPPLSKSEERIYQSLEKPCELTLNETPFGEALGTLARKLDVQIHIDERALTNAGIASDLPITHTFQGQSLKNSLKLLFDDLDLTYVIRDEVLSITTKAEAENMMVTKIYPVFDLVVRPPGASSRGPALDFASLMNNITSNLAPTSWDEVGGPGAIKPFTNAGALAISQTADIHEQIVAYLDALREVGLAQK